MNWEQLRAILWLRWRLTKNQFTRGGQLNVVVAVLISAMLLLGGIAFGVGGVLLGGLVVAKAQPQVCLLIWDGVVFGFLLFWFGGLMVELQRSESVDVSKLLHLPVTLPQVFVLNYVVSHFTPALVLLAPAMVGLCVGMTFGAGGRMALLLPLLLSFIFLVTSWTYCLRGWLAALMVNKRRRRAIIVWLTLALVLMGQLPNLIFNSPAFRKNRRPQPGGQQAATNPAAKPASQTGLGLPETFFQAHLVLPPGWVGYGAMELKDHRSAGALGLSVAGCLIGALGLLHAYRLTLRFYLGAGEARRVATTAPPSRKRNPGRPLLERGLPGLPDDTAALTLATFRSLVRAPEMKMAAIMPIIFGVVAFSVRSSLPKTPLATRWTDLAATAVVVLAAFSLGPTMANAFGLDRNGFRCLVLLPTRRHHILLAKNLAFFPFVALVALLLLVPAIWLAHLSLGAIAAWFLQLPTCFILFCLLCNFSAILVPYRLAPGTLRASKPKPIVFVAVFVFFLILPVIMPLILIPPGLQLLFSSMGWLPWVPVNFIAAAVVLAGVAAIYWALLPAQGRLLQRREQHILREVTEEVE